MTEAAKYITSIINGKTSITSQLIGGMAWEISDTGVKKPFMNFNLIENPGPTKDSGLAYTVSFFIFADTLTSSATIGDILKQEIKADNSLNWKYIRASNGYTSDVANEAFIEVVFNFKL